jgi:hypothetical protein
MSAVQGGTVKLNWNNAIYALVLIRIGQDLGTDSRSARAVHDMLEMLATVVGIFSR